MCAAAPLHHFSSLLLVSNINVRMKHPENALSMKLTSLQGTNVPTYIFCANDPSPDSEALQLFVPALSEA